VSINFVDQANAASHYTTPPPLFTIRPMFKIYSPAPTHVVQEVGSACEGSGSVHGVDSCKIVFLYGGTSYSFVKTLCCIV